jgi:hypothetical protein
MSHYDILKKRLDKLQRINLLVTFIPTIVILGIATKMAWETLPFYLTGLIWSVGFLVMPPGFQFVIKQIVPRYKMLVGELHKIRAEIIVLRDSINKIYNKYRSRNRGEQFKRAYELVGRSTKECEERLAVGMKREGREVWVTCFMRKDEVIRITASIGSAFRCSPADNPLHWGQHINRLGCDELRQYHNHPIHNNRTNPSDMDFQSSNSLKQILGRHDKKLRSFIIYWNQIGEWRIMEYDRNNCWLTDEFDAANQNT